jgi:hypothetical protein
VLGAVAASSVGASQPRASLRAFVCQHALDPPARAVSVTAVMRPVSGTKHMRLRFQLLSRAKGAATFAPISGGDLGTWIDPKSATLGQRSGDVWILHKQVVDLVAPAAYRYQVSFRWIGAHGRVLGTASRQSAVCSQPELRPDLLVESITVAPVTGRPAVDHYVVAIRNAGATAAGAFDVAFSPGGSSAAVTKSVPGLAAHQRLQKTFVGPVCDSNSPPTVTVDPGDQVDDFNRENNSMTAVCPTP